MVTLLFFLGIVVLLLLIISIGQFVPTSGRKRNKKEREEFSEGIQVSWNPIPLILIFIYIGFILWAIAYVVVIGIKGEPF